MALLPQNAIAHFSPFRINIPVDTEADAAITCHGMSSVVMRRSTVPCPFVRDIHLNPICASALRVTPFGENQVATFYDQDYEIRGIVKDSSGSPMQRRVIVLTRDGTRLGVVRSAADGTFKIRATGYLLNRTINVAIPDDGDLRNAVVKWGVVPVTPL